MLTEEQRRALQSVAVSFGWNKLSLNQVKLLAWCAFHYYVERMRS
jgi:hypothetical protein